MRRFVCLFTVFFCLCAAAGANATDFYFHIAVPKATPVISDIVNTTLLQGTSVFKVYATIQGQLQQKACCGEACDRTDCASDDWYMATDAVISPNPPCIPNENGEPGKPDSVCKITGANNPMLYYYKNTDVAGKQSVQMKYDESFEKFVGDIPVDAGWAVGDVIHYYIVAADSAGNVTTMLPDSETVPCTTKTTWDTNYETPASNNCALQSTHEVCGTNVAGAPTCSTEAALTVNDAEGDTCGEPDDSGTQYITTNVGSGTVSEDLDVLGFSAGAGKGFSELPNDDVFCARLKLKGSAPTSIVGILEIYSIDVVNPDIEDPNPADTYFPDTFIFTYCYECGCCSNLGVVLWDGECYSNPQTSDVMGCKVMAASEGESKLSIKAAGNYVSVISKNSLITKTGTKTIIGATSNSVKVTVLNGELSLSSGTPFWTVDKTAPMMMLKETKEAVVMEKTIGLAAPAVNETTCTVNGSGNSPICVNSDVRPASNECVINISPSVDWPSPVTKYKVYHGTTADPAAAEYLPDLDITTNLSEAHSVTFTVPSASLDGGSHYFFFSSVSQEGTETVMANWSKTADACVVEDWTPPAAPTGVSCATPDGSEKECACSWTAVTGDPTVYGYNIRRAEVQLNATAVTDTRFAETGLTNATTYSYSVQTIDAGNNESDWVSASCTAQDLKPPAKVDSLGVVLRAGELGVDAAWQQVADADAATYTLYGCFADATKPGSCETKDGAAGVNGYSALCTKTPADPLSCTINSGFIEYDDWCFYVETCDACKTAGTCPDKPGAESNCSAFDMNSMYTKCVTITSTSYDIAPFWPTNQTNGDEIKTTALPEGDACKLEWNKICEGDDGQFNDCNLPTAFELLGYKIMRAPEENGDCASTTVPSPGEATPVGLIGALVSLNYTDTGLTNGARYCYRVYGYNAFGQYSKTLPVPAAVGCIPADTQPPSEPEIDLEESQYRIDLDGNILKWAAVSDKDSVAYTVYRCEGNLTVCNSAAKFAPLEGAVSLSEAEYMDTSISTSAPVYSYCVTAEDPSGNESAVYDPGVNCFSLYEEDFRCRPPVDVYAYEYDSGHGLKAVWGASSSDDSSYDSSEGYSVYLCTSGDASSCTTMINGDTPVQFFGTEYKKTGSALAYAIVTDCVDCYVGVSYKHLPTCTESVKTVSSLPASTRGAITVSILNIASCLTSSGDCPSVIKTTGGGPDGEIRIASYADPQCADPSDCMKSPIVPTYTNLTDAVVELVDEENDSEIISKAVVGADGKAPDMAAPLGTLGHTYTVRIKLPISKYYVGCTSRSSDSCYITLKTGLVLPTIAGQISAKGIDISDPANGNGGDIGNPTCDKYVNLSDIIILKNAYGAAAGDSCYRAWADFNSDGYVNMTDIIYMKRYYGKTISETAPANAVLCASKAPLPTCCSTKTCP